MKIRPLLMIGVLAITAQYLWISTLANAFVLPEMAVVLLVIGFHRLSQLEIVAAGVLFGYLADNFGAVEQGSLLLSYTIVALGLAGLRTVDFDVTLSQKLLLCVAALIVFHVSLAILAAPVVVRIWFGLVAVQCVSGLIIVALNSWAQRRWDPAQ